MRNYYQKRALNVRFLLLNTLGNVRKVKTIVLIQSEWEAVQ